MAADRGEHAEVEDRAGVLEHPALEQLGRARAPAVLVAAVAPRSARRRTRRAPRRGAPRRAGPRPGSRSMPPVPPTIGRADAGVVRGITSGGANGSSPTSSVGGPSAARRPDPRELARLESRQRGDDHVEQRRERARLAPRPARTSSIATRLSLEQLDAAAARGERRELEHQRQEVGQLGSGRLEPGLAVGLASAAASPRRAGGCRRARGR